MFCPVRMPLIVNASSQRFAKSGKWESANFRVMSNEYAKQPTSLKPHLSATIVCGPPALEVVAQVAKMLSGLAGRISQQGRAGWVFGSTHAPEQFGAA